MSGDSQLSKLGVETGVAGVMILTPSGKVSSTASFQLRFETRFTAPGPLVYNTCGLTRYVSFKATMEISTNKSRTWTQSSVERIVCWLRLERQINTTAFCSLGPRAATSSSNGLTKRRTTFAGLSITLVKMLSKVRYTSVVGFCRNGRLHVGRYILQAARHISNVATGSDVSRWLRCTSK